MNEFKSIFNTLGKKDFTKIVQVTLCEMIITNKWSFQDVEETIELYCQRTQQNSTIVFNKITQHKDKAQQLAIQKKQDTLKSSAEEELNSIDKQIESKLFTWHQVTRRPHEITKAFGYRVYRDVDTSEYLIMSQQGQSDAVITKTTKEALQSYLTYRINPIVKEDEEEFEMIIETKGGDLMDALNFKYAEFDRLAQVRRTFNPLKYGEKLVQPDEFYPMVDSLNTYSPTPLMALDKDAEHKDLLPLTKKFFLNLYGSQEAVDWMMNWFACIYQTNTKSIRSPLIISAEGAGKGLSYQMMKKIYSQYCFMDDKSEIFSATFNGELADKMFCFLDELNVNNMDKKAYNNLKGWLASNYEFNANFKNGFKGQYPLFANFVAFTNDDDPIELKEGDRRWNVFRSSKSLESCDFLVKDNAEDTALTLLNDEHIRNLAQFFATYPINMKERNKRIKNKEYFRLIEDSGDRIRPIWKAIKARDMDWFEQEGIELYKYQNAKLEYGMAMKTLLEKCFNYNRMPMNFFQQLIKVLGSNIQKPKDIKEALYDFPATKTISFMYKNSADPVRIKGVSI